MNPDLNGKEATVVLKKMFRRKQFAVEDIGAQTQEFLAISQTDTKGGPDIHAMVTITTSRLESGIGVSISAIPESLLFSENVQIPQWP